jgi:hypothetical protein
MENFQRIERGRDDRLFHRTKLRLATAGVSLIPGQKSLALNWKRSQGKNGELISADVGSFH